MRLEKCEFQGVAGDGMSFWRVWLTAKPKKQKGKVQPKRCVVPASILLL